MIPPNEVTRLKNEEIIEHLRVCESLIKNLQTCKHSYLQLVQIIGNCEPSYQCTQCKQIVIQFASQVMNDYKKRLEGFQMDFNFQMDCLSSPAIIMEKKKVPSEEKKVPSEEKNTPSEENKLLSEEGTVKISPSE